jgi:6-phosphogluconolactonase
MLVSITTGLAGTGSVRVKGLHIFNRRGSTAMHAESIGLIGRLLICCLVISLADCGGGGGGGGPASYSVGGTVTGVTGTGLVLQNSGGDNLAISGNGPFVFTTKLFTGTPYAVSVLTQPTGPSQTCAVSNAGGVMGASDVTNVAVTCTTNAYSVGGDAGVFGTSGLVLRNNGGDDLVVSGGGGGFIFATPIASGGTYNVTIYKQPMGENCVLKNGTARGTVSTASITTVRVLCAYVGSFLYAANLGAHSISAYSIDSTTGALTAVPGSPYGGALKASYVAAEPRGKFLYALDNGSGSLGIAAPGIDVYSIDAASGALTVVAGSPFPTDAGAFAIAIHPTSRLAYTANINSMSVSAYALDYVSGAVAAPVAGSPFAGGSSPWSVTIDSGGTFAYAANNAGDVSAYAINATTGVLTSVAGSPFKAGSGASSVSIDARGKFAYVANNASNDVSAFTVDANTGALAALAGSPYPAGLNPTASAIDPGGTFLYVANGNGGSVPGANNVSAYVMDANTGALKPVPGSPFTTATLSVALAIDPSGKFLYVANGDPPANNISAFAIDPNTGVLTPVPGSPFAAGANPQSITVTRLCTGIAGLGSC